MELLALVCPLCFLDGLKVWLSSLFLGVVLRVFDGLSGASLLLSLVLEARAKVVVVFEFSEQFARLSSV